ncbi:MAG: DUF6790 family protein [Actinomycetes bacterium]
MSEKPVSPVPSKVLMIATYISGGIGAYFGFNALNGSGGLTLAAILAMGVPGILSFIRHAIFNRSDAVNGGWDYGAVNNFQIEVGLANLAWGVFAILAVALDWGQTAIAASFLISGFYFAAVALFIVIARDFKDRKILGFIGITVWAIVTIWIGLGLMA